MDTKTTYRKDLQQAQDELIELVRQRETLEQKIAKLKRRAALLAQLCEQEEAAQGIIDLDLRGLIDVCRTAMRASVKEWMTISDIEDIIKQLGFPLHEYKAPTASITTTVNRIVEDREAKVIRETGVPARYKWIGVNYGASRSLANQFANAEREKAKRQK